MGDAFLEAMEAGRRAAQQEKARQEVASVIEAFDTQIRAYTGGCVGVERVSGAGPQAGHPPTSFKGEVRGELVLVGRDLRQTLCTIAEYQGRFEVTLWTRGWEKKASSQTGLADALNELLRSPEIGRVFNTILGAPEKAAPGMAKP